MGFMKIYISVVADEHIFCMSVILFDGNEDVHIIHVQCANGMCLCRPLKAIQRFYTL